MHIPVLLEEAVARWSASEDNQKIKSGIYVDATLGGGGHSQLLLEKTQNNSQVIVLGIDRDPAQIKKAKVNFRKFCAAKKLFLFNAKFSNLSEIIRTLQNHVLRESGGKNKIKLPVRGVLFDFGMATDHLSAQRGFSFRAPEDPLDMRFDPREEIQTAAEILNTWDEETLAEIFRQYGEEKYSRRVAKAIVQARAHRLFRQIKDLLAVLEKTLAPVYRHQKIHFATRVFQALRMAVNQETTEIEQGLAAALENLTPEGRLVAISFHSGEDRLVKRFFRQETRDCLCPPNEPSCICGHQKSLQILTRKPLRPTVKEIAANPNARSAKLRAAQKIN
jgi:16S rRNA (cytosine1402-N4)-methyltransferase